MYYSNKMNLNIIYGPMFSGKTTTLIRTIDDYITSHRLGNNSVKVLLINSKKDDRYERDPENITNIENLTSHTKMDINMNHENIVYRRVDELLSLEDLDNFDCIAIDECQFFGDLLQFFTRERENEREGSIKKTYFCAGLISDYKQEKFGDLLELFPLASNLINLKSFCSLCYEKSASFTAIKDHKKDDIRDNILISGCSSYMAVCHKCIK